MGYQEVIKQLTLQKILPLFYHEDEKTSIHIVQALYEAGIRSIEYTNRGEYALTNFKSLKKRVASEWPGLQLGIGTIKNITQAKEFIDAGADYIICPTTNVEVATEVHAAGLMWIPGCMTPTEISNAEEAGAKLVKIFPGNILGPGYINSIKELFPGLLFMPTGGVENEKENLAAWFRAGVIAVGMGSKLLTKALVDKNDYEGIKQHVKGAMKLAAETSGAFIK